MPEEETTPFDYPPEWDMVIDEANRHRFSDEDVEEAVQELLDKREKRESND
ncbi:MAG: hypothetical protein JSS66_07355 [Armatimonadetes bacterium]|nr:hypothetical protein [Armatimonadota bacterium]